LCKEEEFFSKIIDVLNEFGLARLTWDNINNAPDIIKIFFAERAIKINELIGMEAQDLDKLLLLAFSVDYTSHLSRDSKAYIFIDNYKAQIDKIKNRKSSNEKDSWIRELLIPNMHGIYWVICGGEKLTQAIDCDPAWGMYLEQILIDKIPESYCT